MDDSVLRFYDDLADNYHLLFEDWKLSVLRQGEVLDRLLAGALGEVTHTVLDCCCGIGTQAIGLALRGHRVHATDLSSRAVARGSREAAAFGASLTFGVADFRTLGERVQGAFDVVIACDNALPHLLTNEELDQAVRAMYSRVRPGGLFLATIRDYDTVVQERPRTTPIRVLDGPPRRISFQFWDWSLDGTIYQIHQFILIEGDGGWQTTHYLTTYRALLRQELEKALLQAGLEAVCWHMPGDSGFYQPVVTARKPASAITAEIA